MSGCNCDCNKGLRKAPPTANVSDYVWTQYVEYAKTTDDSNPYSLKGWLEYVYTGDDL